jgi:hypothetical protein
MLSAWMVFLCPLTSTYLNPCDVYPGTNVSSTSSCANTKMSVAAAFCKLSPYSDVSVCGPGLSIVSAHLTITDDPRLPVRRKAHHPAMFCPTSNGCPCTSKPPYERGWMRPPCWAMRSPPCTPSGFP